MKQKVVTSRVSDDIYAATAAKADADGVSLSAIVERALKAYLDQLGDRTEEKPAWALELERRVSQLESQGQAEPQSISRKSKRRR